QWRDAREMAFRVEGMEPDNSITWGILGVVFTSCRDYGHAHDAFMKAVQLGPGQAWLHNNLAASQIALGQLDAAVLSLRECLRLAPGYGEAHWTLASLGRKDLASTHARELEQLLARASDDPHVAIPAAASLFRVHETLGEYDKAFS